MKSQRTPRSTIKSALRRLFLRSKERSSALKRDEYKCQRCGKKQSRTKGKEVYVECHHVNGMDWQILIDIIYDRLLCHKEELETLCKECHKKQGLNNDRK